MRPHREHPRDRRPLGPGGQAASRPAAGRPTAAQTVRPASRTARFPAPPTTRGRGNARRRTGLRRLVPRPRTVMWGALGGLLLVAGVFGVGYVMVDVPDPNKKAVAESNLWLYQDGSEIGRSGAARRTSVPLSQVSRPAREATLAAEDRTFYKDPAISLTGLVRAVYNNVTGGARQGGSGITQQYVKNFYLTQEQSLTRKFKELFIAVKVDQRMSKDDILAGYLNTSYYGRGAYGIESAAHSYYGEAAKDLTAAQGAYLAALLNAPSRYDVSQSPEYRGRAVARWNYVMDGMRSTGALSEEERASAVFPEPLPPKRSEGMAGQNGYLMQAARDYLVGSGTVDEAALDAGGWTVRTTFDKAKQAELIAAVDGELRSRLKPAARSADGGVRVGAASVENGSGKVVALYGGPDYVKQFVNDATRRDVQAGSTFKPFALAAALEEKAVGSGGQRIGPRSLYDGGNDHTASNGYAPGNQGGRSYGRLSVREAMARSVNTVFVQLAEDAGLGSVRDAAVAAGLPSSTPGLAPVPALPLGVATPSAVDLAGAYATFGDRGVQHDPRMVVALSRGDEKPDLPEPTPHRAFSTRTADTVTDVLRGTVDAPYGTGRAAQAAGRPSAGKTGTTNEQKSFWYVGYTPELTTSVGVFREDPESHARLSLKGLGGESGGGGGFPARVWAAYTKSALAGTAVKGFRSPAADSGPGTDPGTVTGGSPTQGDPGPQGAPSAPLVPPTPPTPPAPAPPTGPGEVPDGSGPSYPPGAPANPGSPGGPPDPGGPSRPVDRPGGMPPDGPPGPRQPGPSDPPAPPDAARTPS